MPHNIIGTLAIIFTMGLVTDASGGESFLSKICNNDVPDCICRWCCPNYCHKPLPQVCGPLPPHLTCGPTCYVPFWCQNKPACSPKTSETVRGKALETPPTPDGNQPNVTEQHVPPSPN